MAIGQEIGFFFAAPGARVPTSELDCMLDNYRGCAAHRACAKQDLREFNERRLYIGLSPQRHLNGLCQKARLGHKSNSNDLRRGSERASR